MATTFLPLTLGQQQRVEENMGLVGAFIRRYPPPHYIPIEDYHQELSIGLCRAAATYSDTAGSQFSTWAFHQFWGVRSSSIRKYLKPSKHERQGAVSPNGSELLIESIAIEDHIQEESLSDDQCEVVMQIFSALPADEQDMLAGVMTTREIGERIGISHQAVQFRKSKLVERLRAKLSSVFPADWRREEGFFRMGLDLPAMIKPSVNEGG